jgi:hypothetical protein
MLNSEFLYFYVVGLRIGVESEKISRGLYLSTSTDWVIGMTLSYWKNKQNRYFTLQIQHIKDGTLFYREKDPK